MYKIVGYQDCRVLNSISTETCNRKSLRAFEMPNFQKRHRACRTLVNILEPRLNFFASVSLSCGVADRLTGRRSPERSERDQTNPVHRHGCPALMVEFGADPQADNCHLSLQSWGVF